MDGGGFLKISRYTDQGRREKNEDSLLLTETEASALAVVADGLGGHADGEIASQQAVQTLQRLLQNRLPDPQLLTEAIRQASRDILSLRKNGSNMRTTVAALWLGAEQAVAAHVGDSRIYQFRDGQIIYQSVDHSVAQMSVLMGELRQEELRGSKDRNKLIRALGGEEPPKVDCCCLTVAPGDRFLLCSDGFWEPVTEQAMLEDLARTQTAGQWLGEMKERVLLASDPLQDNHSAIAVLVKGDQSDEKIL